MKLTLENFQEISKNQNVLNLVEKCLKRGDNLVVDNNSVGEYVCSCDLGTVQLVASDFTKPKAIEFERQAKNSLKRADDSFDRCDTDGFLSQYASRLHYDLYMAQAVIAEDGGVSSFERLFVVGGPEVDAKLIDGKYGACWLLSDDEADKYDRRFIPFAGHCTYCNEGHPKESHHAYQRGPLKGKCKKCKGTSRGNSRIQKSLNLVEGWAEAPAHAVIKGNGTGLGGSAWVEVVEVSEVYDIYKDELQPISTEEMI